jgi:CheY-like chemotaxis protein
MDLPVAVLSADATPAQVARLKQLGAEHYLTKPVDIGKLLELFDAYSQEARASV